MTRPTRVLAAAAALAGLALAGLPGTAQAASYLNVCNSSNSVGAIRVYNRDTGWNSGRSLQVGDCFSFYDPTQTKILIDMDVSNNTVGSWKIRRLGNYSYGPCHAGAPSGYDPPPWNDTGMSVQNFSGSNC